jgi:hypothetical protein
VHTTDFIVLLAISVIVVVMIVKILGSERDAAKHFTELGSANRFEFVDNQPVYSCQIRSAATRIRLSRRRT